MRDARVTSIDRAEVLALLGRALDEGALTVGEYDARVVAAGSATYLSQLLAALDDLPPEYAWLPAAAVAGPVVDARGSRGRAALILGILSLPTSFCVLGGFLGLAAIVVSLRGERAAGLTAALIGRVFGIVGLVLSLAALFAILYALNHSVAP